MYSFPGAIDYGLFAEEGPDYDYLGNVQSKPTWFHCKIATAGTMEITMWAEPESELAMVCWGPFDSPDAPCPYGLTEDRVIACDVQWNCDNQVVCNIPKIEIY